MKKFQILNKDGVALTISQLDAEAAKFWGKEVHPKNYANPFPDVMPKDDSLKSYIEAERENAINDSLNWYDTVGYTIANQGDYTTGWNNVINTMVTESLGRAILGKQFEIPEFIQVGNEQHLPEQVEMRINAVLNYFKPFVNLIKHWESKGYTPVSIE